MSDVQKFSGYIAADGTHHKTQKLAIAASLEFKTKAALADAFVGLTVYGDDTHPDQQTGKPLAEYLYEFRAQILDALNQEVLTRKKRTPKPKVATPTSDAATA